MEGITLREFAAALDAKVVPADACMDGMFTGTAVTDNREAGPGDVFFAFIGEKNDAHRFVGAAFEQGAAGAVVSKLPDSIPAGKFCLLVDDTQKAYGRLAAMVRSRYRIPVTAVTGSVGKTTMKDMIACVLAEKLQVLKTEGNLNNHIGMPRTLLRLDHDTEAAVIEMGMNHKGEISYLTGIGRPTMAVITNIGDAHIGNLGSRENIFRAKCEIFEGLQPGGTAFLNGDDILLRRLAEMPEVTRGAKIVFAGERADCDYRAADIEESAEDIRFTMLRGADTPKPGTSLAVTVPKPGRHMIYPALIAAAVADTLGLSDEEIRNGIAAYSPTKMRMEIHRCPGNITVYNDTYNANPQSVMAGLSVLAAAARENGAAGIAVLGDMLELGTEEQRLHEEVGRYAASLGLRRLVTVGEASRHTAAAAAAAGLDTICCVSREEAMQALDPLVAADTVFLVKASRGMALEEISAFLIRTAEERFG